MKTAKEQRQNEIINYLQVNNFASTNDLMGYVNYSEATIKRDLVELEKLGLIRRTRGGAIIIDEKKIDMPFLMKISDLDKNNTKQIIADAATELIQDDMILFIDSSSTCLHLINNLHRFDGLHIITNGILAAFLASEKTNARVSVLSGSLVHKRATIHGTRTYQDILTYNTDMSFISCKGFDFENGANESSEGEALIKKAFRRQTHKTVVLLNRDRVGQKTKHQSLSLSEIDYIVCDKKIESAESKKLQDYNIEYINV